MPMRLSKTQYIRGLQCLKSLWLHHFRPDLRVPVSPALQRIFEQGRAVGELARRAFPGGILIAADHDHIPEALQQTQSALQTGVSALFEPAFVHDDLLARPDILVRDEGGWDLIEVKASTDVKEVYLPDVAAQRFAVEGSGLKVRRTLLMHVDNAYVRKGPVDPHKFFRTQDVSALCAPHLKELPAKLAAMQATMEGVLPEVEIGAHCSSPYDCDFRDFCWKHVPDYSVYDLKRADFGTITELRHLGVMRLEDIPPDFGLTDAQEIQVRVAKTGEPHIDGPGIRKCLQSLAYPLHYLDFETVAPAIPPYDGLRPFQALPFQASLHVQAEPDGKAEHLEFLGDPKSDPRAAMVDFLIGKIGPKGSVVVYNASFEGGRLAELAEAFPRQAKALLGVQKRLWDLAVPFRTSLFMHPDMRGSASMKAVLPALVPGMDYDHLDIGDGVAAFLAYESLMAGKLSAAQAKKTMAALREYCGQDTLGMVEILRVLGQYAA
ncbi:MAG: DUF2779 domain-containing protein [Elusimicrobia bacterium]|nr:DUF2779 domain-containing protein [Elusimicrobiota bacterium]